MLNRKSIILSVCIFLAAALFSPAFANYSIKQMTPEVEAALESRRGRFDQLAALKAKGVIGENNMGYVENLGGDDAAAALVTAENSDRKIIYQTIAEQNGLSGALATIEEVFAQVQRDKAQSGEKIQTKEGNWITK